MSGESMIRPGVKDMPADAVSAVKQTYEGLVEKQNEVARRIEKAREKLDEIGIEQGLILRRVAAFESFLKHLGEL